MGPTRLPSALSVNDQTTVRAALGSVFTETDVQAVEEAVKASKGREFDEGAVLLAEGYKLLETWGKHGWRETIASGGFYESLGCISGVLFQQEALCCAFGCLCHV